jgi:5'-methylthioadenosine/S-adenosylhomocysteine nucleosidase
VSRRAKPLTLILGAMPSEVAAIDAALVAGAHRELEGYPYQRGKLGKRRVVVAVTGVGITNAAMTAALFVHHFRPTELVFTGSGARLNPAIRTGDIIISSKTSHHNAGNWTDDGMVYRKVRGPLKGQMTPYEYRADPKLLRIARAAARTLPPKTITANGESYQAVVKVGKICSGDVFGITKQKIADIRKKLGCDLIEMEGSAAAQVCWQLGVPHIVIRSGSNLAQPDPGEDYRLLGQIAAHQAARFTMHFVKHLAAR